MPSSETVAELFNQTCPCGFKYVEHVLQNWEINRSSSTYWSEHNVTARLDLTCPKNRRLNLEVNDY